MPAAKKTPPKAAAPAETDIARQIWLAGVGAYGRAFDTAQDGFAKLAGSASDGFEFLVKRGEALEDDVKARIEKYETVQKVSGVVEKMNDFRADRRAEFQNRVSKVREVVGTISPLNILGFSNQLEALTKRVEVLEAAAKVKAPAKPSAKR
jgi:hypothetical protein